MPADDDASIGGKGNVPDVPNSVKGAPVHLRQVIRKRQNSESAKRSRQRRKEAASRFYQRFDQQCQRISTLEKRVSQLTDLVKQRQKMEDEEVDAADEQQQETQTAAQQEKPILSISNEKAGSAVALDIMDQPVLVHHPPDLSSDGAIAFEEDLEALLDSCLQNQYYVDGSRCLEAPFC